MGTWNLVSITGTNKKLVSTSNVGHQFTVKFKLKYTPSTFGSYAEMPDFEWNEVFTMKEYGTSTWWEFSTNMYPHNIQSPTLSPWPNRYLWAYDGAHRPPGPMVNLFKADGVVRVTGAELGTATTDADKTKRVHDYLKRHGGVMELMFVDNPSLLMPKVGQHKERLLVFDCGVAGGVQRYRGWQHLEVDESTPATTWCLDSGDSAPTPGLKMTGFTRVAAPTDVSTPRVAALRPGQVR